MIERGSIITCIVEDAGSGSGSAAGQGTKRCSGSWAYAFSVVALRFLRGGLKCDPANQQSAGRRPGIFEYFFGGEGDQAPQMVDFELVNNAYHVLDSLLLGLATVLRRPADKVIICPAPEHRISSMPHPRRLLTRDVLGLVDACSSPG